jgi:hypothetical protein
MTAADTPQLPPPSPDHGDSNLSKDLLSGESPLLDDDDEGPILSYPDAPDSLIELWNSRRRRMSFAEGEGLPPLSVDLQPLLQARIPHDLPPDPPAGASLHGRKLHGMRLELAGKPELAALNSILIAHLRKASFPRDTPALFRRIWTETGPDLTPHLPGRWLISSIITFGDHGETEAQRRIGLSMNVLLSLMKLYEFERLFSGLPGGEPFPTGSIRGRRLPLDMPKFALVGGGLDVNLLAQLWSEASKEPVAGALASHILHRLNADPDTLFRRIGIMRARKEIGGKDDGS